MNDKNFSLTTDVKNLKHDLRITQKSANESKTEVDNLAQYLCRDCVEIIGLKPTEETTCVDLVMAGGKDTGVDLEEKDISTAHPLPTRNRDVDSKLIVKLTRWAVRDEFYSNRKKVAGKKVAAFVT